MNKINAAKVTQVNTATAPAESEQRRSSTTTRSRDVAAVAAAFSLNTVAAVDPQLQQQYHTELRRRSSSFLSQCSCQFCLKNCDGERGVKVNCGWRRRVLTEWDSCESKSGLSEGGWRRREFCFIIYFVT